MKLKDFFAKNIQVNCDIEVWYGTHDNGGELLQKTHGNETDVFHPWYDMDVVYMTTNKTGKGIVLEVQ